MRVATTSQAVWEAKGSLHARKDVAKISSPINY